MTIITVWHICNAEDHKQCTKRDMATVQQTPNQLQAGTIIWELHPSESAIKHTDDLDWITWTEAMQWPYQITTK